MADVRLWPTVIHQPLTNASDLAAIDVTSYMNGVTANVINVGLFVYNNSSSATADNITVIQPTVGPGRWLNVKQNLANANSILGSLGTSGQSTEIPFTSLARSFSAQTTTSGVRGVLGAAASGANTDITSLTTPLGIGTNSPNSSLQLTRATPLATGSSPYFTVTSTLDTGLTAGTEVPVVNINNSQARTWVNSPLTLQRDFLIGQPTYKFDGVGATTLSDAATFGVAGCPIPGTNVAMSATHAVLISSGSVSGGAGGAGRSYGLTVNSQTGATSNFIAQFVGVSSTGQGVGICASTPSATLQISRDSLVTSGSVPYLRVTGFLDTGLTASTEVPFVFFDGNATRSWAAGSLSIQREVKISKPTYNFASASTITDAATLGVVGSPAGGANATITNSHGLLISSGSASNATNSYGLTVNSQTGATNNYIAQFRGTSGTGLGVGIGTATPTGTLQITRDSAATSGSAPYLNISVKSDTGLTASTNAPLISTTNTTRTWAAGSQALLCDVLLSSPVYAAASASTTTIASTLAVSGPTIGPNMAITTSAGIYIQPTNVAGAGVGLGLLCYGATNSGTSNACAAFMGMPAAGRGVGIGITTPNASLQVTRDTSGVGGAFPYINITVTADTSLTASAEIPAFNITNSNTRTWAAGSVTTQREVLIGQPTYAFASASTITDAASIGVAGSPKGGTNATITNSHGILVSAASLANATNGYGLTVNSPTNATTTNTAAQFIGNAGSTIVNQNNSGASSYTTLINTVNTTDATVTTIQTITLASNTQYTIRGLIRAQRTGGASGSTGDGAGYSFFGAIKNIAGTVSVVSTVDLISKEDQTAWNVTFTPSGSTLLIQVTGASGNNITWDLFLEQFGR